mmetsp:Transcript_3049/g.5696  ORF Transcript_3049/g.5696 Transcript_3049/m.5696 type:complete len:254 (+) Transcript_3049:224-985(+)
MKSLDEQHVVTQNHRFLNQALEDAKNMANETYNGLKRTVMDNMVLTIVLASAVLALLILCCYLRRKYTRSAQVVSRREYNQLLRNRKRREMEKEKRRNGDEIRMTKRNDKKNKGEDHDERYSGRSSRLREEGKLCPSKDQNRRRFSDEVTGRGSGGGGGIFATNTSMETIETSGTFMSQHEDIEFVGDIGDVESGDQGFEVEVSPIKGKPEQEGIPNGHYLESDFDFENDDPRPQENKRFQWFKKKNNQQGTI